MTNYLAACGYRCELTNIESELIQCDCVEHCVLLIDLQDVILLIIVVDLQDG